MTRIAASRFNAAVATAMVAKRLTSRPVSPAPACETLQPAYLKTPARRQPSVRRSRAARKAAV